MTSGGTADSLLVKAWPLKNEEVFYTKKKKKKEKDKKIQNVGMYTKQV